MEPFIGQICVFGFDFAPKGWAQCNGQLLPISQYSALFSLLGTTYGGDGRTTFGLPDFRGRVALNQGQGPGLSMYSMGQSGGSENVTLSTAQMPSHSHPALLHGNGEDANASEINGRSFGVATANIYNSNAPENGETLNANSIQVSPVGDNQPHPNLQPYLTANYCIAVEGVYPSRP